MYGDICAITIPNRQCVILPIRWKAQVLKNITHCDKRSLQHLKHFVSVHVIICSNLLSLIMLNGLYMHDKQPDIWLQADSHPTVHLFASVWIMCWYWCCCSFLCRTNHTYSAIMALIHHGRMKQSTKWFVNGCNKFPCLPYYLMSAFFLHTFKQELIKRASRIYPAAQRLTSLTGNSIAVELLTA